MAFLLKLLPALLAIGRALLEAVLQSVVVGWVTDLVTRKKRRK